MPKRKSNRLDDIAACLETLHRDAEAIFAAHCAEVLYHSKDASPEQIRLREIVEPAGQSLNYIAALKLLNKKIKAK
jgi:hypothetical protein